MGDISDIPYVHKYVQIFSGILSLAPVDPPLALPIPVVPRTMSSTEMQPLLEKLEEQAESP
jgi:hypothetical protein